MSDQPAGELKPVSKLDMLKAYVQFHKKDIIKKTAVVVGAAAGIALVAWLANKQQESEMIDAVATDVPAEIHAEVTTEVVTENPLG